MSAHWNEIREIRPAAPDGTIRRLLALTSASILPLEAGTQHAGPGGEGEFQLFAALRGSCTAGSHKQYALLKQGQALAIREAGPCSVQAISQCLCAAVRLQGELAERLLAGRMTDGAVIFSAGAAAVREAVLALAVREEEAPSVSGELASSYAYSLLLRLHSSPAELESGPALSPLVESAIAIIQEEFPFLEGLDELAQRLEVSKAHLGRSFAQSTGISPGKYITRVRVEYAKLLLQNRDASITYAAEASGFANANYFAKVFRKETGMSPSEYIEGAARRTELRSGRQVPIL